MVIYVFDTREKKVWERSDCKVLHRCLSNCLVLDINLLKTTRNLLYRKNRSVPRSKHFPLRL